MHVSRFRFSALLLAFTMLATGRSLLASGLPIHVPDLRAQFGGLGGMAAGKLLQEFHLPGSPSDLFEFVLEYELKQKIGNTLPLNLDAKTAFPTVENAALPAGVPGGAFQGKPIPMSATNLLTALAPGDYVVPVIAYCTQYSVHRPGQGTAYKLAPVEGTQAEAIATLLWRGTLAGKSPQELQATNWAIQSGMNYNSMPKPYRVLIDELIPDYKDKLKGNPLDVIQATYKDVTGDPRKFLQVYIKEKYNKTVPLMILPKIAVPAPPLEVVLGKIGPAGRMVLDARKQSDIMLTAYTTRERGEQTLFEGQGEQLPPEPAAEGPWTVRVPGQAYVRFIVKSGNMHGDNLMQIRILPNTSTATVQNKPRLILANYATTPASSASTVPATSVYGLLGVKTVGASTKAADPQALTASGVIGYSVGGSGAQALVPTVASPTCSISSQTVATLPANRSRTRVGIGEAVLLSADDPSSSWSLQGQGTLSLGLGSSTTFTAADRGGQDTVTATVKGQTCSVTFTVVEPASVVLQQHPDTEVLHKSGRADVGFAADIYILPDDVSFENVQFQERPTQCAANGIFAGSDRAYHRTDWTFGNALPNVVPGLGTQVNAWDCVTADGDAVKKASPPFVQSQLSCPIIYDFKVGGGQAKEFANFIQLATAKGDVLTMSKGGVSVGAMYKSNGTYFRCRNSAGEPRACGGNPKEAPSQLISCQAQ